MQGRNSDVQFNNIKDQIKVQNFNKKHPHHLKISDRLQKTNMMLDANSTFINIDRSKSGIGAVIASSQLGGINYGASNN